MQAHLAFWKWLHTLQDATSFQRELAGDKGPRGGQEAANFLRSKPGRSLRKRWEALEEREALIRATPDPRLEALEAPDNGVGYLGFVDGRRLRYASTRERSPKPTEVSDCSCSPGPTEVCDRGGSSRPTANSERLSGRTDDVPSNVNPQDAEELHNLIKNLPRSRKRYLKALTSSMVGSLPLEFLDKATQLFKLHTNLIMAALRERGCDEQSVEAAVFGAIPLLLAIQGEQGRRQIDGEDSVDSDLESSHERQRAFAHDIFKSISRPPT